MQKKEFKTLVTNIYDELIKDIDSRETFTKEHILSYLQDVTNIVSNLDETKAIQVLQSNSSQESSFQELVDESLTNYKDTNSKFEDITQEHEVVLQSCSDMLMSVPDITNGFSKIQDDLSSEVKKTNTTIKQLTQKVRELEISTCTDPLTKLYNRRALNRYLESICFKGFNGDDFHLLILDLDDFKLINDTYGHIAGDKVLLFIATLLKKTLRGEDKIFRYGGEEFIIALNNVNYKNSLDIGNKILKLVSSNKLLYRNDMLNVTISIGLTSYKDGDTPDDVISRADKALYASKNHGKNQINVEL